jgi:site-specific recombinase XerD
LESFRLYCKACDYSVSTQKSYQRITENFISYLEARKQFAKDVSTSDLSGYVNTLMGYSYKMVEFMLCGTRVFLRFLHTEKYLSEDLSRSLPWIQTRRQIRIPSVWEHDDLFKLLGVIDRGNPSGKRDYAMILLVTRLGLRSIDVKRLTFSNLKWEENRIELIQSKTHEPVSLPLLKDVGWAIIDYLKNDSETRSGNIVIDKFIPSKIDLGSGLFVHLAQIIVYSDYISIVKAIDNIEKMANQCNIISVNFKTETNRQTNNVKLKATLIIQQILEQ